MITIYPFNMDHSVSHHHHELTADKSKWLNDSEYNTNFIIHSVYFSIIKGLGWCSSWPIIDSSNIGMYNYAWMVGGWGVPRFLGVSFCPLW